MTEGECLLKAKEIATRAHRGQFDRGGHPYINHPAQVVSFCTTPQAQIVAWLHDVIEDTSVTLEMLRAEGFPESVLSAVRSVTRQEGESYDDFVRRSAVHPIGREVKLADLRSNMDICRLRYPLTEADLKRLNKYLRAYRYITEGVEL